MKTVFKLATIVLTLILSTSIATAQKEAKKRDYRVNTISMNNSSGSLKFQNGFWTATKEDGVIHIQLTNSRKSNGSFFISFSTDEEELTKNGSASFELNRASGKMVFNGQFPQKESMGKFTFTKNSDFENFLKSKVLTNISKSENHYFFKLFLGDVTKSYVNSIQKRGYKPTLKQLSKLAIHDVSLAYIDALERTNYRNLELDMLIKFTIHDISIDYINELDKAGYGHIDAQMLKRFAIHDVSANYIKDLSAAGYGNLEANMLKRFATHNINSDYIKSLLAANISRPSANDIKKAKIHRVSANFIKEARSKGHNSQELSDYIRLKIRGSI